MKKVLTKNITKYHQTDRKKRLVVGGVIAFLLAITPFLFYLYTYAPVEEGSTWKTTFFEIKSGRFINPQAYVHAVFTKITFIIITALWFITSRDWWKWAILIPLTMFLFQFIGVINYQNKFIDEFDFWYALPIIIPILVFLIWISSELNKVIGDLDLKDEIEEELEKYDKP